MITTLRKFLTICRISKICSDSLRKRDLLFFSLVALICCIVVLGICWAKADTPTPTPAPQNQDIERVGLITRGAWGYGPSYQRIDYTTPADSLTGYVGERC